MDLGHRAPLSRLREERNMRTLWLFNPLLLLLVVDLECGHPSEPVRDGSGSLYFSSFESDADTAGWVGYGSHMFNEDAPPGGGGRSLHVAGGCIVPHAQRIVVVKTNTKALSLEFWGKNLALGGGVGLRRSDGFGPEIHVSVQDTVWTRYRASAAIPCRPGDTLILEMMSGGIVYSAMRVDLVEVRGVE